MDSYGNNGHRGPTSGTTDPTQLLQSIRKNNGAGAGKYKQKVGAGFDKTKSVASTGFKKVKVGTSVGFQWIKDKCQKTTQKN